MTPRSRTMPLSGQSLASVHEQLFRRQLARMPFDGCERSLKLVAGRMMHRRLLAGLHRQDVSDDTLIQLCGALGMPASSRTHFERELAQANVVHFGFEQGPQSCAYKVYLEFGARLAPALRLPVAQRLPVEIHQAFKWDPERPDSAVLARYTLLPDPGLEVTMQRLDTLFDRVELRRTRDVLRELVHLVHNRLPEPWMVLQVSEDGQSRHSYDLSCYGSRLRLRDIGPWLWQLADCYGVPDVQTTKELQPVRDCLLGHIAAGVDRQGADFVTIYHEAESNFGPGLDEDEI